MVCTQHDFAVSRLRVERAPPVDQAETGFGTDDGMIRHRDEPESESLCRRRFRLAISSYVSLQHRSGRLPRAWARFQLSEIDLR